jgi:hypothetical protein
MIAVRNVGEAGVQCEIENSCGFQKQARRRTLQPGPPNILVGSETGELLNNPQKLTAAKPCLPR